MVILTDIGHVNVETILAIVCTLIVSFAVPILCVIFFKKKTKCSLKPALIGASVFLVMVFIVESLMHALVIGIFKERITSNIWIYAIYGGLAAATFEEVGRYIAMKYLLKDMRREDSIMYGLGHGGAESILTVGLTYISNIVIIILINAGLFEGIVAQLDEQTKETLLTQLAPLWESKAYIFLLAGVERTLALGIQLIFSYFMYKCIKAKKKIYFVLSFALHFFIDSTIVLISSKTNIYITLLVLFVYVLLLGLITYKLYRSEQINNEEKQKTAQN